MREKNLEDKRREMAVIISKLNEQNEYLQSLISRQNISKTVLESIYAGSKELDILEITNYKDFLGKMGVDIKTQQSVIEKTQILLKVKQLQVTEALKEVKILEKLKETQEKKFYQHYNYVESKEIDDIASTRYHKSLV